MKKIYIAGIGPGSPEDITPAVHQALREADVVVGYAYYFQFIQEYLHEGAECIDTGMRQERERARLAIERAEAGQTVCVISSGDAGIYGMAPLLYEMCDERGSDVELEVLPGISAFQKAAALLGAPIGHDLCIISLSDLMTPWAIIERRAIAAAEADFVTALYNPKSIKRYWQLERVRELFLKHRSPDTPVGLVQQAGRPDQRVWTTTLRELDTQDVDMFTVLIIGNSQSFLSKGKIVTPRGYYRDKGFNFSEYNGKLRDGDENYVSDLEKIKSYNRSCRNVWLASRYVVQSEDTGRVTFYVASVGTSSSKYTVNEICIFGSSISDYSKSETMEICPVFTLKDNVKINGGSGTSSDPYTLTI